MKLLDLFPPCTATNCTSGSTGTHKHILPGQKALLESDAKYICALGGYGSGKTLAGCILAVQLSLAVPGNRGIVMRRTYSKLHDSTEKIFLEVLDRIGVPFKTHENRDGWPHRIQLLEGGSEVLFRETKDLGRFLGPEYGWFLLDEAGEEPEKTFLDLISRLRLPRAKDYLRGILLSNPPHDRHWIAGHFGLTPGKRIISGTTYHLIRSTTLENFNLPADYVADLRANHPESEVNRILMGEYGFAMEGTPVYMPPFRHNHNVAPLIVRPATIARGWDFGYRAPAVTWHQFLRCVKGRVHWFVLDVLAPQNLETEEFAKLVFQHHKDHYAVSPDSRWKLPVVDVGDASGAQHNERGPGPILRLASPPWNLKFKYRKFKDIDPGLDLVRLALRKKCECGYYILQIARQAKPIIDMFAGGYHYPRNRSTTGAPIDKPVKDNYYDNIADSIRYVGELLYRPTLRDPKLLDDLLADQPQEVRGPIDLNAWMGE